MFSCPPQLPLATVLSAWPYLSKGACSGSNMECLGHETGFYTNIRSTCTVTVIIPASIHSIAVSLKVETALWSAFITTEVQEIPTINVAVSAS